jgi:hypothetical protein
MCVGDLPTLVNLTTIFHTDAWSPFMCELPSPSSFPFSFREQGLETLCWHSMQLAIRAGPIKLQLSHDFRGERMARVRVQDLGVRVEDKIQNC